MSMLLAIPLLLALAGDTPLFNGKNLDGWESVGDGQWTVMKDGTVLGQRTADLRKLLAPGARFTDKKEYQAWENTQAWLYTQRNDFGEFDLHVEFWTKSQGNSGISIRDSSRGRYGAATPPDFKKTPSKIGYEIQINNRYPILTPPAASMASSTPSPVP